MQQDRIVYRSYPHEVIGKNSFRSTLSRKMRRRIQLFGASLTSFAMASFIVTYTPSYSGSFKQTFLRTNSNEFKAQDEDSSKVVATVGTKVKESASSTTGTFKEMTSVFKEAEEWGVDTNFSIVVPAIDAKSRVVANVDPYSEDEYKEALKHGVAHASGTSKPGGSGTVYLFAHSTDTSFNVARYNAVFYQLKSLQYDDRVFVFYNQQLFEYRVIERHVVAADDISWLEDTEHKGRLILQTCDPPGTTWKRLLMVAELI